MSRSALFAAAVAALLIHPAAAQQSQLIGVWSISYKDQNGNPWLTAYLEFSPNGSVRMKGFYTGGSQPLDEVGTYRLDPAGTTVSLVFTQCRTVCQPSPVNLNEQVTRGISFDGPNTLHFSDGAVYTRASAVP